MAKNAVLAPISQGTEVTIVTEYVPFRYFTRTASSINASMGTSPITPCYDAEQLETKTHVGLGPGKTLQMWMARTSRPPRKCLKWTLRWMMPRKRDASGGMGSDSDGALQPQRGVCYVIASTNHLEILCFVTGPTLARLPKPTKSCSDSLYEAERSIYTFRALTRQSRDSWLPVGGGGGGAL